MNNKQTCPGDSLINSRDWRAAEIYFKSMFREGKGTRDKKKQITALRKLGIIAQEQGKFMDAFDRFNDALRISKTLGDNQELAYSLIKIAHLSGKQGNNDIAKAVLEKAQTHAHRTSSRSLQGRLFLEMANLLHNQGKGDLAKEHYRMSLELLQGNENNLSDLARAYNNMGDTYLREMNYELALEYFKLGETNAASSGNITLKCYSLDNMAKTLARMGRIEEGKQCLLESEKLSKQKYSPFNEAQREYCQGLFFAEEGKKEKAIKKYHKALVDFKELSFPVETGLMQKELGLLYLQKGEVKKAKEFLEKAKDTFASHHVNDEAVRVELLLFETML